MAPKPSSNVELHRFSDDWDDYDDNGNSSRPLNVNTNTQPTNHHNDDEEDDGFSSDAPLNSPTVVAYSSNRQPKWYRPSRGRRSSRRCLRDALRPRLSCAWILGLVLLILIPVSLFSSKPLLVSPLPDYTGPYNVGAIDVEVPLEKPVRVSETVLRANGEPAFVVETVLFTIYYPIAPGAKGLGPEHYWIPKPVGLTAQGYARLAHLDNFITRPIITFALWALAGGVTIPGETDAPLLDSDEHDGSWQRFPVMVFSHGMASSRTDYTNYLGELASRGRIIAAIEHRDGSSPGSLIRVNGHPDRRRLVLRESDVLQRPPPQDPTAQLKQDALAFRDVEIFHTVKVLQDINDGHGAAVFERNSRGEGESLTAFADRLDFTHLTIGGHSFGATGALQALKGPLPGSGMTIAPPTAGLVLDPGKSSGPLNDNVSVPLLVVHSNSWSSKHSIFYGRPHFDTVRDLVSGVLDKTNGAAWFVTSLGTSHPSVTDAPLLEPTLLSWTTGATIDVKEGLKEYVRIASDFFNHLEKGNATGVLAEAVTHRQYGEWVSEKREKEFPTDLAKYWEVHVSPVQ
jgi:platelet-activating factor acetylhydrolase